MPKTVSHLGHQKWQAKEGKNWNGKNTAFPARTQLLRLLTSSATSEKSEMSEIVEDEVTRLKSASYLVAIARRGKS